MYVQFDIESIWFHMGSKRGLRGGFSLIEESRAGWREMELGVSIDLLWRWCRGRHEARVRQSLVMQTPKYVATPA